MTPSESLGIVTRWIRCKPNDLFGKNVTQFTFRAIRMVGEFSVWNSTIFTVIVVGSVCFSHKYRETVTFVAIGFIGRVRRGNLRLRGITLALSRRWLRRMRLVSGARFVERVAFRFNLYIRTPIILPEDERSSGRTLLWAQWLRAFRARLLCLQLTMLFCLLCVRMCLLRWSLRMNFLLHSGHWNLFSPVCVRRCRCSSSDRVKRLPQNTHEQTNGRSPGRVHKSNGV